MAEVAAGEVLALRRRVLRDGTATGDPRLPEDGLPGTRHLAIRSRAGEVVATSTWVPAAPPGDLPGGAAAGPAVQLRAMAVAPEARGRGLGAALLQAGVARAAREGKRAVWARARDGALGFYEKAGFSVVGGGFVDASTGLPHHLVVLPVGVDSD